jgi:PAS domain S-box-containing protein
VGADGLHPAFFQGKSHMALDDKEQNFLQMAQQIAPLFDASHNGIVIIDRQGKILIYNKAAMRIFNDSASPVGMRMSQLRPETWPDMERILQTGQPQIGVRLEIRQTTIIANRSPVMDNGRVVGLFSVFQDISEYEAIVSQLEGYRDLVRELEAIFENSQDGMYLADCRGKTLRVNQAYEKITELDRNDLLGRHLGDLVKEGVLDHSVTLDVLEKKCSVSIMQNIRGGKRVLVTGTPIFDKQGKIALVVSNVRDMTALTGLRNELDKAKLLSELYQQSLREQDQYEHALEGLVAKSKAMSDVIKKAIKVAGFEAQVLIRGESGVGKSMLARVIHNVGPRKDGPFTKINCGVIPESLMESELFGYEKGAFTGAASEGKAGLVETGQGGTVFFDEVGELTPAMQVKLLQVIDEKTFTRVGGTKPVKVDVHIIAATNRDLDQLKKQGRFRDDLYYRLNVVPISIPPLRERSEDVLLLALKALEKLNANRGMHKQMRPEVLERLIHYDYPGNVRELINLVERMVVMSDGQTITLGDLPETMRRRLPEGDSSEELSLKAAMARFEARLIQEALHRHPTLEHAAKSLGIHTTTLWRKLKRGKTTSSLQ